jgi:hypothetical protein
MSIRANDKVRFIRSEEPIYTVLFTASWSEVFSVPEETGRDGELMAACSTDPSNPEDYIFFYTSDLEVVDDAQDS